MSGKLAPGDDDCLRPLRDRMALACPRGVGYEGMTVSLGAVVYRMRVAGSAIEVRGSAERSVLDAFERDGRQALRVGCRNGGCGVCRVQVLDGEVLVGKMSMRHVSTVERAAGYALACRIYPRSDLVVAAAPKHGSTETVTQQNKHQ